MGINAYRRFVNYNSDCSMANKNYIDENGTSLREFANTRILGNLVRAHFAFPVRGFFTPPLEDDIS